MLRFSSLGAVGRSVRVEQFIGRPGRFNDNPVQLQQRPSSAVLRDVEFVRSAGVADCGRHDVPLMHPTGTEHSGAHHDDIPVENQLSQLGNYGNKRRRHRRPSRPQPAAVAE